MSKERFAAVIIGTGFSGLVMAIKLKERGIHDFIILEKAKAIGGTWRENTYPGAECDVPSALYSYSFAPYTFWEFKWSKQPQILEYIKHVVSTYDLEKHIEYEKEMLGADWDDNKGIWITATKDGSSYESKFLISAIGQLHYPSIPEFNGRSKFKGPSWHSAQWNHDIDLKNKTIGVIGNAASALQFIPEIAKEASKVAVFQRSANWVLPKRGRAYKEWEKKLVARLPILLKIYRFRLWLLGGGLFFLMKNGNSGLRKMYQNRTLNFIKRHINDPEKIKALTPTYPLGAKRVLFSDYYYPTLALENVSLITENLKEITPSGVKTKDDKEHVLDALVFSTGFKTNPFLQGLDIKGKNGISIREYWKNEPKNYLGMTVCNFPNLFIMYGPNTNLGHNSILIMSEAQASYIAQCASALENQGWKSMEIRESALNEYHENSQERLNNMIWAQVDNSWYRSDNGNIPNNYPGRTMEYMWATRKVKFDDYILR